MAILTEAEMPIYAPSVTLTGVALDAQIAFIQGMMESPMGADRPLEIQSITEVRRVNWKTQTVHPRFFPIADPESMTVEVRTANRLNGYHRASGAGDWDLLNSDQWNLNENGRIDLSGDILAFFSSNCGQETRVNEARLTYSSGFDFSEPSPDVNFIKAIAGQILSYQMSPAYSGIKRQRVDQEYEIEWQSGNVAGGLPLSLFVPLKKYIPRNF